MNLQVLAQLVSLALIILSGPIVVSILAYKKASVL